MSIGVVVVGVGAIAIGLGNLALIRVSATPYRGIWVLVRGKYLRRGLDRSSRTLAMLMVNAGALCVAEGFIGDPQKGPGLIVMLILVLLLLVNVAVVVGQIAFNWPKMWVPKAMRSDDGALTSRVRSFRHSTDRIARRRRR